MSQICKYYLRGTCRYGSRCHFLHEDNYNKFSGSYNQYSYYSNRNHSQNYSQRTSYGSHSNKEYSNTDYSQNYSNKDYTYNFYSNKNSANHSRYHVDNRKYNQIEVADVFELAPTDILDLIRHELKEFEERHIWPLSVIAPLKDLGNIPGFRDFSPEEIRYQYYEACRNNTLHHFNQGLNELKENVIRSVQIFKMDSNKAVDIVKKMQQKSGNLNEEEMATEFDSSAVSSFSFDLQTLSKESSFRNGAIQSCGDMAPSLFTSQQEFSANANTISPTFSSLIPSGNDNVFNVFNNPPAFSNASVFGTNVPSSRSELNSFSFNLNNLTTNQNAAAPSPFGGTTNKNMDDNNNNVYSVLHELSPKVMEAFQAKTFKFGQIPLVSPPKELCFN